MIDAPVQRHLNSVPAAPRLGPSVLGLHVPAQPDPSSRNSPEDALLVAVGVEHFHSAPPQLPGEARHQAQPSEILLTDDGNRNAAPTEFLREASLGEENGCQLEL